MQELFCWKPRDDKTNKVTVRSAKTQTSLGIRPVWSVFAVHMKKAWVLSYPLSAQWRPWLDWADALADLSLRWPHSHFVCFVMLRLKYIRLFKYKYFSERLQPAYRCWSIRMQFDTLIYILCQFPKFLSLRILSKCFVTFSSENSWHV